MTSYEIDYGAVLDDVETASVNAATWARRRSVGNAQERGAANDAIDSVDAAIRKLYILRGRLISETVKADVASLDQYDAYDTYAENIAAARAL